MEAFIQLMREFGPIVIIYYLVFHAGPTWLKQMSEVGVNRARLQDAIVENNISSVTRLLDLNEKERTRNSEVEGAMSEAIRYLSRKLDEMEEAVKNVATHMNDVDQRMGDYARSTTRSLEVISTHILGSKGDTP